MIDNSLAPAPRWYAVRAAQPIRRANFRLDVRNIAILDRSLSPPAPSSLVVYCTHRPIRSANFRLDAWNIAILDRSLSPLKFFSFTLSSTFPCFRACFLSFPLFVLPELPFFHLFHLFGLVEISSTLVHPSIHPHPFIHDISGSCHRHPSQCPISLLSRSHLLRQPHESSH